MFASPTKINERIGMGLGLQQLRHHLALQTAEGGGCPHRFTCRTYCVDRNVSGEIHTRPRYRIQGPTVAIGGERAGDRSTPCSMPVVDHDGTASAFHDQLNHFHPGPVPGEADLSALTARPPPVGPGKLLILQSWPSLLLAIITDDQLPPAVGMSGDDWTR